MVQQLLPHGTADTAIQMMQVVNVGVTDLGDSFIESLTYGRRLAAWATKTGE